MTRHEAWKAAHPKIERPTLEAYSELEKAYDFFNKRLFNGILPPCLVTLQREKQCYGYFSEERFVSLTRDGVFVDEIAMNPAYFSVSPITTIMQVLVHEMCHLWQAHFGSPGRGRYHNHQWADKMEEIGLMPSSTGKPGGKKVGDRVADYPIQGGRFMAACESLITSEFRISWADRFPPRELANIRQVDDTPGQDGRITFPLDVTRDRKKPTREKFTCPGCGANMWGSPNIRAICAQCGSAFVGTSKQAAAPARKQERPVETSSPTRSLEAAILDHALAEIFDTDWFKTSPGVGITCRVRGIEQRPEGRVIVLDADCGGVKTYFLLPFELGALRNEVTAEVA